VYSFRPISDQDIARLDDWVRRSHVARWWTKPENWAERVRNRISEIWIDHYIVGVDGHEFGFIQCYRPWLEQPNSWPDQPAGTHGIDQFIADPDMLGRGHGSAFVRQFVDGIFASTDAPRVITDPSPDNARAVRAYGKAMFKTVGQVDAPDGRALLMLRERPTATQTDET